MANKRMTFSSQEKVRILREHLLEKVPISDLPACATRRQV